MSKQQANISLSKIFKNHKPETVVNLAAQAGVRYSIINPESYINSNTIGFYNALKCLKSYKVINLLYVIISSVYGGNKKFHIQK